MEGESFPFRECILSGQWRDPCGSSIGQKGGPYTWTIGDYEELSASEMMFARKFDIDVDERIIFKLATELMK